MCYDSLSYILQICLLRSLYHIKLVTVKVQMYISPYNRFSKTQRGSTDTVLRFLEPRR